MDSGSSSTSIAHVDDNSSSATDEFSRRDNDKLHLTLDNFESDDVPEDCPYVLTSPRSLAACKIVGIRVSHLYK